MSSRQKIHHQMQTFKKKLIIVIVLTGLGLIALFYKGLYTPTELPKLSTTPTKATSQADKPMIISTNPSPLEDTIILPTQTIELTFNYPIIAISELKYKIDPQADIKIELSADKKLAKIIPVKPYNLGSGYTLFILPDTKVEGGLVLKDQIIYHFKTIGYKGI